MKKTVAVLKSTTPAKRFLSVIIALSMIFVSLPYLGMDYIPKASALTGDGNVINSDTKNTFINAMSDNHVSSSDSRFTYTGKITKAKTTLFDYVSDYELMNSYNNVVHKEGGFDDAYTSFNNAISQSNNAATPLHAYTDNITITLETTSFSDRVFIYLFKDSNNNGWPGKQMTYDSANNRYTYTFSCSSTNTSSPYWLNFTPNSIIFTDGTNTNTVKSRTISQDMAKGNTYSFVETNLKSNKIIYQYEDWAGQDNLHIHYWLDDDHHSEWNGPPFHWDSSTNTYLIEVDTSTLGYVPTNFLFNKGAGNDDWKTSDLPYDDKKTRKGFTYYCKWDNSALAIDEYLNSTFSLSDSSQQAQPIYSTKYTNPLYFGCFWRSNTADASNTTNYPSSSNPGYNANNKAAYNNFWWQVNMGLKTINDDNDESSTNHFMVRGTTSTQGLVYNSLNNNDNLVDINGTTELPYFDKNSSLVTNGLMKYYDKDETGDNIQFPFYEVRSDAATNVGSDTNQLAGTYQAYTGEGAVTQYAKFYQFDSKESNVRFQIAENESTNQEDPSLHKGHFLETSQAITHSSTAGYFPFNNVNKANEKQHNLGFGTKYEMTFKLQSDGCVGVVDENGNDLDTNDYKSRVHTIFEFEGDDDLWVFIDGNLVLDMGGDHLKSHGIIDFANRTATVDKAITIGEHRTSGYSGNDNDDLGVAFDSNAALSGNSFNNALKSNSFTNASDDTTNADGTDYDYSVSHTITVFYMERGMLDSNLLIRFNYTPEANFSKMKIAEVTDYSAINIGLQPFFQQAAENDVFKYTVENKGTVKADVLANSAEYPTNENRTRKNEGDDTVQEKLTAYNSDVTSSNPMLYIPPGQNVTQGTQTVWQDNTDAWNRVSGTSYLWVDGFTYNDSNVSASKLVGKTSGTAGTGGNNGNTTTGGELFLMYGTCNNLYPPAGTEKVGVESSAEFEKTFTRDSIMQIEQSNDLHKPLRTESGGTLQVEDFSTDSGRDVSDYYTTTVRLVDRDGNVNKTLLNNTTEALLTGDNLTLNNNGKFRFNNASTVNATSSVMLTEYFVNTPKKGAITVTKQLDDTQNDDESLVNDTFTFRLYLTNVFGVSGVNVINDSTKGYGYDKIKITRLDENGSSSAYSGYAMTVRYDNANNNYGEFELKAGETITINDIPYNTEYTIVESSNSKFNEKTSGTQKSVYKTGTVAVGTLNGNKSAHLNTTTNNYDENTDNNAIIVNTRLTGTLNFRKILGSNAGANNITNEDEFSFHVQLTPPAGVDLTKYIDASDISALDSSGTLTAGSCSFNVTVTAGDTSLKSLSGIPYGTTYEVTEPDSGISTSQITENTNGQINSADITAAITNNYPENTITPVTVKKTDESGNGLMDAEFRLYYRETTTPESYSFNEQLVIPGKLNSKKITNSIIIPEDAMVETELTVPTTEYSYGTYSDPPSLSDSGWILPRSDSDYIYFRDYNSGTPGEHDKTSFDISSETAWRNSFFAAKSADTHYQDLEIDFADQSEWIAAQFTADGKQTVQYAVWERFVDKYNSNDTVVWKIQPPDGYTHVRFMLYKGDNCIRTTEKNKFELGKIYHKTNWGGMWKSENGNNCYFNVPVTAEGYWAPSGTAPYDNRMSAAPYTGTDYTRTMNQAKKYEPTEQKVIFHCNSDKVWHNIHIMFYDENDAPINGMSYPGYMMEPYAYAGNEYRTSDGYLTYELTIPFGAKSFRINNGAGTSTTYGYYTAQTLLRDAVTDSGSYKNKKNYANYYCFDSYADQDGTLKEWRDGPERLPDASYSNVDVSSDYDYIYFEKPAGWNDHIYAYFYAGGNLRADNWQRACYSAWPGVAAAGTEYGTTYSTTYNYPVTSDRYNGTAADGTLSPDAVFTGSDGNVIYKFRIPKGDRKNYSKVIFNDGLVSQGGGKETGVIDYKAGYLYKENGTCKKQYEKSPTVPYTARSGNDDYIYIKTNDSTWDDIHIIFYDANGTQMLQGGHGYVMEYSGTSGGYDYYRIPVPETASKFSLNNGIKKDTAHTKELTGPYDILRKTTDASAEPAESDDYTRGRLVYTLTSSDFTRTEPVFVQGTPSSDTIEAGAQPRDVDFINNSRSDKLCILNAAPWNDIDIGTGKVKFYDTNGDLIGAKAYTLIKSEEDADEKNWFSIDIPDNAVSFSVIHGTNTTVPYEIYPYSTDGTNMDGSWTSGGMYYKTNDDGTLSLVESAVQPAVSGVNDENYVKRGDNLYLLTTEKDNWKDMKVTFYGSDNTAFLTNITAEYINKDGDDYWYKVSIPKNAAAFTVTGKDSTDVSHTTAKADIYELKEKFSRYQTEYTLGDMQYRLADTGSDTELLYPVFTEDDDYTLKINDNKTISSRSAVLVNDTAVSGYADASAATAATVSDVPDPRPVLYQTDTNNISYSWTEGTAADDMLRFEVPSGWSGTPTAQFYNGNNTVNAAREMTIDSGSVYKVSVPDSGTTYDGVVFTCGSNSTTIINLSSYNGGKNYKVSRQTSTGTFNDGKIRFDNSSLNWSNVYVRFWNSSGSESSATDYLMTTSGDGIYEYTVPSPASYNMVRFLTKDNGSVIQQTLDQSKANGGSDSIFTPNVDNSKIYFRVASSVWNIWNSRIYAYFYDENTSHGKYESWGISCLESNYVSEKRISFNLSGVNNSGSYNKLIVFGYNNDLSSGKTRWQTEDIDISGTPKNGGGRIYQITATQNGRGHYKVDYYGIGSSPENSGSWSNTGTITTWSLTTTSSGGGTYTAEYQPEDRYGMISNLNISNNPVTGGTADADNYIYINTSISDPYIMFYSDLSATNGNKIGGTGMAATGIRLADVCGNTGSPYRIRLPKDALLFRLSQGNTTLSNNVIPLSETITVKSADGTLYTVPENNPEPYITLTDYRHAGSCFAVNNDGSLNTSYNSNGYVKGKKLRSGFTFPKQPITDQQSPMTDSDYIFFTDVNGDWSDTVYAYYYGGADGEYTAWPGIKASKSDSAPLTYTDNNGKNVFMFRIPAVSNGKYPYVIFNNGSASDRKVTQAVSIMNSGQTAYNAGGNNYSVSGSAQHYGTYDNTAGNYVNALPTVSQQKSGAATTSYNTGSGNYIYIVNNGTYGFGLSDGMNADGRYVLDDMHVVFYDQDRSVIGTAAPGYKPDKLSGQSYGSGNSDVYRIPVPANAKFFQINNGQGKCSATSSFNHDRSSEIREIIANGLYQFVDSSNNTDKVWNNSTAPASVNNLNDNLYYLDLVNKLPQAETEEELLQSNTTDIHLATVVTGPGGTQKYIKWLRNGSTIDTDYLDHVPGDVYPDSNVTTVKVKKQGEYYWKEVVAPGGYELNTAEYVFTLPGAAATTIVSDTKIKGDLILEKKLLESTAVSGDEYENFIYHVKLSNASDDVDLRNYINNLPTGLTISNANYSAHNIEFDISITKDTAEASRKITDMPYGTSYVVTEADKSGWLNVEKSGDTGSILSSAASTASFTNARVGSLKLKKTVDGAAPDTLFSFSVVLSNNDVSLSSYDFSYTFSSGAQSNGAGVTRDTNDRNRLTVTLKDGQEVTISGIPTGTHYQVTESDNGAAWTESYKLDNAAVATTGLTTPGNKKISAAQSTVEFINAYSQLNDIILSKTAKEKVRTYNVGNMLTGAGFQLIKVNGSTQDNTLRFTKSSSITTNEYALSTGGSYNDNSTNNWLVTGADGKLHITGLEPGDYFLVEKQAPAGFSVIDSNTGSAKKVEFSVGENTVTKEINCSDEMNPAYIRLFEHVNEVVDAWGKPTFIFRIRQTAIYDASDNIQPVANGREMLVSLTVDENGKWTEGLETGPDGEKYRDTDDNTKSWYEESTKENEYKGLYHIGSDGKIRVEPGQYEISRFPVSRYRFIENTWKLDTDNNSVYTSAAKRTQTEELTITVPATRTATVHYYDQIEYYDKFSHDDTDINSFYKLDENYKNKTIKGIRIADYHQTGESGAGADTSSDDLGVPVEKLTIYRIFSDGSEEEMSLSEKQALTTNFNVGYTAVTGDKASFSTAFSYSRNAINVDDASDYENGVYTLKATYTCFNVDFEAYFDIVFLRQGSP